MKYREKVNKNVKKREIWKLLPWQQQIHHDYIITFFGEYHNRTSYNNFNIRLWYARTVFISDL